MPVGVSVLHFNVLYLPKTVHPLLSHYSSTQRGKGRRGAADRRGAAYRRNVADRRGAADKWGAADRRGAYSRGAGGGVANSKIYDKPAKNKPDFSGGCKTCKFPQLDTD